MNDNPPLAAVPITLAMHGGSHEQYREAAAAVAAELQLSRRWTRLVALSVRLIEDDGVQAIYEISVGQSASLDWTLEGSTALRPTLWHVREDDVIAVEAACDAFAGGRDDSAADDASDDDNDESAYHWIGDVVATDRDRGTLFVSLRANASPPRRGAFWVEPFAFLKSLHEVYSGDLSLVTSRYLPDRVAATRGGMHPRVANHLLADWQRQSDCAPLWQHGWSILWGPPGTGKTHVIGQEIAPALTDPDSRVLIVSTTNRASDEVAVRIGREANRIHPASIENGDIVRIGKSADLESFESEGLQDMLGPESIELRRLIAEFRAALQAAESPVERARLNLQLRAAYGQLDEKVDELFFDPNVRVVVCTVYAAIGLLRNRRFGPMLDDGQAPFSTVVIDEAGLVSRAAAAALSLHAADRVWLVGDSRQLSPISRIERILAESKSRWLAKSGLSHLDRDQTTCAAVTMLSTQHRMHPEIGDVVSNFHYDGLLQHAADTDHHAWRPPAILNSHPRAIWYVLDEETRQRSKIRATRGPGQRSWIRLLAIDVLKKLFQDTDLADCDGRYITPFRGQVAAINDFLRQAGVENWSASSVHTQQGTEADVVIFDTVNAGKTCWEPHEWKRLINVGISRARHALIVIASRDEMKEPYMQPLPSLLYPAVLKSRGGKPQWRKVTTTVSYSINRPTTPRVAELGTVPVGPFSDDSDKLGDQLTVRESLRPVFSAEQQRLCELRLDGKPRLVRGVAGSGKTVVLAHWLARTVRDQSESDDEPAAIWVVYANMALSGLLTEIVHSAWQELNTGSSFPWERVHFHHVRDVLDRLLLARGKYLSAFGGDINAAAAEYLTLVPNPEPVCRTMFIDESQDFGPDTLRLLAWLTEQVDPSDGNSKNLNLFYDNAQNVYHRELPKWSDLGVDLRGRSTVMQESFRSTRPITEYALNVLCRVTDAAKGTEHRELERRDLVRLQTLDNGQPWWQVRYNETEGPEPGLHLLDNFVRERQLLISQLIDWMGQQNVRPSQICILFNGRKAEQSLRLDIAPQLEAQGIHLNVTRRESIRLDDSAITATTAHSFKGYDAEIVWVFHAGGFALDDRTLGHPLYVAMTRAKSHLILSGHRSEQAESNRLLACLRQTQLDLREATQRRTETDREDIRSELVRRLGVVHTAWIDELLQRREIKLSPLLDSAGKITAEPLFHFRTPLFHYACFADRSLTDQQQEELQSEGYTILFPGDRYDMG